MWINGSKSIAGKELIELMIAGEDRAWVTFLDEIGPMVRGLALKSGLNEDDIEDIAQMVVIKLLENNCRVLRKLDFKEDTFFGWVKVVVSRQIIDYIRGSEGRERREVKWSSEYHGSPSDVTTASDRIELRVSMDMVVSRLSREDQVLYRLHCHDLSDKEIARILGLTQNAAQQRISRMKKKLRKIMEAMEMTGG